MRRIDSASIAIGIYALLALLVVPVYPHFMSPAEFSRWVFAVALVDFHTIEVTPAVRATGMKVDDLSEIGGRLYSNKAPGAALVGIPGYVAARAIAGKPGPQTVRATLNAMRLVASSLPTVLLAFWVCAVLRRAGCPDSRVTVVVVALLFGTPLLPYGITLFGHALSAFALFGAWALLFQQREKWSDVGAGALIGLAVITEHPMAVPAAVILACAIPLLRVRGALRVMAGGAPFALLLALYTRAAFGSYFSLSYRYEEAPHLRALAASGLFGIGPPSWKYLAGILADPSKGLFVLSPVLLVALAGIGPARRAFSRPAFLALILAPLAILVTMSGYPFWFGGWTVGVRYIVAALPFLAVLLAFARESTLEAFLLGASVLAISVVSLVFPFVPEEYPAPWATFAWPMLRNGFVVPNLLHFVARPLAIAVPFLLVAIAATLVTPRRRLLAMVAGAAVWVVAGFAAARSAQLPPPYLRAMVEEVHFGHRGTIARTIPPGPERQILESVAAQMQQTPPPSWPF